MKQVSVFVIFIIFLLSDNILATTIFCSIYNSAGQPPSSTRLTFFSVVKSNWSEIITEDGYNSALGTNQGYFVYTGIGYWFVNFDNYTIPANPTDSYRVYFYESARQESGISEGSIPYSYQECDQNLTLAPLGNPAIPTGLTAFCSGNMVEVNWNALPDLNYLIYKCNLPSGAGNGHSSGVYQLLGERRRPPFLSGITPGVEYWFMLIARDRQGRYSGHTAEVFMVPAPSPTKTPVPTNTPVYTTTGTPTQRPSETPTQGTPLPTGTATPTGTQTSSPTPTLPTSTPSPSDTETPTETKTPHPTETALPTLTPTITPCTTPPTLYDEPPVTQGTTNTIYWELLCPPTGFLNIEMSSNAAFPHGMTTTVVIPPIVDSYMFSDLEHDLTYYYRIATGNSSDWSNVVYSQQDARRPLVELGGYWDTALNSTDGGNLRLFALVLADDVITVEVYYENMPTGIYLSDNGPPDDLVAGDKLYSLSIDRIGAGLPTTKLTFELATEDAVGNQGVTWPYLVVE